MGRSVHAESVSAPIIGLGHGTRGPRGTHHMEGTAVHDERISRNGKPHHRTKREALTCIEVLVVIWIVALLVSILLPALRRVGSRAKALACRGNLHQWGLVLSLWQQEHDSQPSSTGSNWDGFQRFLQDGQQRGLLLCPMARRHDPFAAKLRYTGDFGYGTTFTAWRWPSQDPATMRPGPPLVGSYGLNSFGLAFFDARLCRSRRTELSATPILLDSVLLRIDQVQASDEPPAYEGAVSLHSEMTKCCINRHGGGINSLRSDWSASKVGLKELWTLKWSPWSNRRGPWTKAGGVQPGDWPGWMKSFKDF